MLELENSEVDIDLSTDERDVEEVMEGVVIGAKKWIVDED